MPHNLPLEFLPAWLPDETLFSLSSRYHFLTGHASPRRTARILFGSSRSGYQHDLPSGVDHFATITEGQYGTCSEIIRTRTLFPYYGIVKSTVVRRDALAAMSSPRIGPLKYQLGLLTSGFRANHPLKACLSCMADDEARYGIAYWHLLHQLPGVMLCRNHKEFLVESNLKASGVQRFNYILPQHPEPHLLPIPGLPMAVTEDSALYEVARVSDSLVRLGSSSSIKLFHLQRTCLDRLMCLGQATQGGRIRRRQGAASLHRYLAPFHGHRELGPLLGTLDSAQRALTMFFGPRVTSTHPLRVAVMIAWLFGDWLIYQRAAKETANKGGEACTEIEESKRDAFLQLIRGREMSVSTAAKQMGIDPAQGIGIARTAGIIVTRRRKHVRDQNLLEIKQKLMQGEDRCEIAASTSVSQSTVARVLYSNPDIAEQWVAARLSREKSRRRGAWEKTITKYSHLGIKVMRNIDSACYSWLYRNDHEWLESSVAQIPKLTPKITGRVDWASRDLALEEALRKAIERIGALEQTSQISIGRLCQLVPDLKRRLGQTNRLPRTRRLLELFGKAKRHVDNDDSLPFA